MSPPGYPGVVHRLGMWRAGVRVLSLCAVLAAFAGWGFYEANLGWFRHNKQQEALTALQLVDAFIREYNGLRGEHSALPLPTAFRAHALERFNQSRGDDSLRVVVVGVPGRQIVTVPSDPAMAATVEALSRRAGSEPIAEMVELAGEPHLRMSYPSVAVEQSCVDCHNRHQGTESWKVGDVLGAAVLDVPLAGFLAQDRAEAIATAFAAFLLLSAVGLYILSLNRHQSQDRRTSLERLRHSEERFRDFAETASDWFWEQDENLRFTYMSPGVAQHGGNPNAHIGKTRREKIGAAVSDEVWTAHEADLAARRPFSDFRFYRVGADGHVRHIAISGKPWFDPDGRFRGYRGTARDVTAAVNAERELERRVEARTAELRAAQDELLRNERLATLGQLTATVSHELRNPLGVIRNTMFTIAETASSSGLSLERPIARIERSLERCDLIIADLLDYTRSREVKTESVAVDPWLADLLDEQTLPGGVELVRRLDAGIVGSFDPHRLRRAVINLVENAVQATTEPDGTAAPGARIEVLSRLDGERLEIVVRDNGGGIDGDVLPRIFEPLFSTKGFGVGLGLPTVRQIMQRHAGGVEVTSEKGRGTEARLWLPLVTERGMAA